MSYALIAAAERELDRMEAEGLAKHERVLTSPQGAVIDVGPAHVLNLCANNYLGLADHPRLIEAAKRAMDARGLGLASVRFICGTNDLHRTLEAKTAAFLGMDDAITFAACFDANGGVFEALLGEQDAVISDSLNHASIIDGVRLSKARRLRFASNDMADLKARLEDAADARHRLVVTDGVFSMDGVIADLPAICDLAEAHDALVMVDDCHATGFLGPNGAGTPDHHGVVGRVHLVSGTFGKALGGAMGGFVAGPAPLIRLMRNRARPYLFSNALAPALAGAAIEALAMIGDGAELRARLEENARHFRARMSALGFTLAGAGHPIIPVMLGDAPLAVRFAARMMELGVYVTAFSFPVVPRGQARIRTQMSAAHTVDDLDRAVDAFALVGRELGVI
ncbi:MAG: glycine C-acetyltransferase [Rhodobacteraceae bacterium]|nr:glycine C-acetyltransferase [Paracoccaceae bacterium]